MAEQHHNGHYGVFAVARKLYDPNDDFFGGEAYSKRDAWQWLIAKAYFRPGTVKVRTGRGHVLVELDRGQLCHSRSFMATSWGWTEKRVRVFLDALERREMIARTRGQQSTEETSKKGQHKGQQEGQLRSVISICKYCEYQFEIGGKGQVEGQQNGPAKGQQSPEKGPKEEEYLYNNISGDGVSATPTNPRSAKRQKPKAIEIPAIHSAEFADLRVSFMAYAATKNINPREATDEFDGFVDHSKAKGNVWADWNAAGQNWLRRSLKFAAERSGRQPGRRPDL